MPNSNISKRVAAELRAEMARKQISVPVLAERAAMSVRTLHRSMKGERSMTVDELGVTCEAIGVSVLDVLRKVN